MQSLKQQLYNRLQIFKKPPETYYCWLLKNSQSEANLLFYQSHRLFRSSLKIDEFKAAHKGQMELYLKWLDKYEKEKNEKSPIGLILCAEANREQVELLQMHEDGIMVAEYWSDLPPKEKLEQKLHNILIETKERIETQKILENT
ncbi:MAG: hypothetical protein DRQ51_06810 [Gammaproteobacteria bacterium]|nr:MAG: hypothetical protein DRQ51_06810 [Gammaproteobacteria bacterium]